MQNYASLSAFFSERSYFPPVQIIFKDENWSKTNLVTQPSCHQVVFFFFPYPQQVLFGIVLKEQISIFIGLYGLKGWFRQLQEQLLRLKPDFLQHIALSVGIPQPLLTPCAMVLFAILLFMTNHKCSYHLCASLPLIWKHTYSICHHLAFSSEVMRFFFIKNFWRGVPQAWNTLTESTSCSLNCPLYNFNYSLVCLGITGLSILENNWSCLWVWEAELGRVSSDFL